MHTDSMQQRLPLSSHVTVPYGAGRFPSGKPLGGRMGYTLDRMLRAEQGFLPLLEAQTYGWPHRRPILLAIHAEAGHGTEVRRLLESHGIEVLGRTGDVMEAYVQVRDLTWLSQESQVRFIDRSTPAVY